MNMKLKLLFHAILKRLGQQRYDPPDLRLVGGSIGRRPTRHRTFEPGATSIIAQPGETITMGVELPPEIVAQVQAGAKLQMIQGPARQIAANQFCAEAKVLLDGVEVGTLSLEWSDEPV